MSGNDTTMINHVNTLPKIWERNFDLEIRRLGKANNIYIDVKKHLKAKLGKCFDYVMGCIDQTRRFGYGFHYSDNEFLESMQHTLSLRTLSRRKVEAAEFIVVKHGVKNRSFYYLNKKWFENFINDLLIKLGIQQRQSGVSHIISNDHTPVLDHIFINNIDFKIFQEYDQLNNPKVQAINENAPITDGQLERRIKTNVVDPKAQKEITWFAENFDPKKYQSKRHALNVALKRYRLGRWSTPRAIMAAETKKREDDALADKKQFALDCLNNPILDLLRPKVRRVAL